jgi:KDO2-lipid IV(A) lauroyltransferase
VRLRSLGDYAVYLVVRALICVVQAFSLETCAAGARVLAWLFADVLRVRRRVVDDNLSHAFPQVSSGRKRRLARRMWEHLFLLVVEVAHAPRLIHDTNWRDYVRLQNAAPLVRALLDQRPTLLVSAHFGNFELAGYALGVLGFPTHTVARTLDNPFLDGFVNRFRGATGQHIIAKKGGYEEIVQVLSSGGTMTFLADQYAGSKGCWVEFFSRPASVHKAIALFALDNDAPLAVGYARRTGRPLHYELAVEAIVDPRDAAAPADNVRDLTAWYTRHLEHVIRRHPEQYWWLHRRWKDHRPAHRRRRAA